MQHFLLAKFVSGITFVSTSGRDENTCLSDNGSCGSFKFALSNGASVIILQSPFQNIRDSIILPGNVDAEIMGQGFTVHDSVINFKSEEVHLEEKKLSTLTLLNLKFSGSILMVTAVHIVIINCSFENSFVGQANLSWVAQQIYVDIVNTLFTRSTPGLCLELCQSCAVKIKLKTSILFGCELVWDLQGLALAAMDSSFKNTKLHISVKSYFNSLALVYISNSQFYNTHSASEHSVVFLMTNPYLHMESCTFHGTSVVVHSRDDRIPQRLFLISVLSSEFSHAAQKGNGGAMFVHSALQSSRVSVSNCTFHNNKAERGDISTLGYGGAVYVFGTDLSLLISNSIFENNIADEEGSAMYFTSGVNVHISNCLFVHHIAGNTSFPGAVIAGKSLIVNFGAKFDIQQQTTSSFREEVKVTNFLRTFNVDMIIKCPKWYTFYSLYNIDAQNTELIDSNSVLSLEHLNTRCLPCAKAFYTGVSGESILKYVKGSEEVNVTVDKGQGNPAHEHCMKCPYGATCTGSNVVARPNYWGFWHNGELHFQQCPAGYCCTGTSHSPCENYNTCAGNRTGDLCGSCEQGYSVAILTGSCTNNKNCGNSYYFWVVACAGALLYALWYTLKDPMMNLVFSPGHLVSVVKNLKCSQVQNHEKTAKPKLRGTYPKVSEEIEEENPDKNYFGIVTYFVQMSAVMKISIEFSDVHQSKSYVEKLTNIIAKTLNMELTQFSFDVCPVLGLTTVGMHMYKFTFLIGIYLTWLVLYFPVLMVMKWQAKHRVSVPSIKFVNNCHHNLIKGLVEIIKYTYSGFCGIIFMSLICTEVKGRYVWWYDASEVCLELWQMFMVMVGLVYAFLFPFVLYMGMKSLRENAISSKMFIFYCLCPISWVPYKLHDAFAKRQFVSPVKQSGTAVTILTVLQGPFRDDRPSTLYWEGVISGRRLVTTAMTLLGYGSIRMVLITVLSILFQLHHIYVSPFQVRSSNHVETVSLTMLILVAVVNLLKASLTDFGVIISGPAVPFFKVVEFVEKMFVFLLISYILAIEVRGKCQRKRRITPEKIPGGKMQNCTQHIKLAQHIKTQNVSDAHKT